MTGAAATPPPLPPRPASGPVEVRIRPGRLRDVPELVRLYLSLSPAARYRFHPFPFNRVAAGLAYSAVLVAQRLFSPFQRRHPRFLVGLLVAEVAGVDRIAGYGTMRGVLWEGMEPRVRFGFVVGDEFRGYGVGPRVLRAQAQRAVDLGYRWEIGAVFKSDTTALKALTKFGVRFYETDYRDPKAPDEENYFTEGDLHEILRLIPESTGMDRHAPAVRGPEIKPLATGGAR